MHPAIPENNVLLHRKIMTLCLLSKAVKGRKIDINKNSMINCDRKYNPHVKSCVIDTALAAIHVIYVHAGNAGRKSNGNI